MIDEDEDLPDLPRRWRPSDPPPKDTWVRPSWFTEKMFDHYAYRVVGKAELIYFATTGRIPTAATRAKMIHDDWFRAHVERTGRLPHTSMRARRAARDGA